LAQVRTLLVAQCVSPALDSPACVGVMPILWLLHSSSPASNPELKVQVATHAMKMGYCP